jgi:Glycosyl hydrolase family 9
MLPYRVGEVGTIATGRAVGTLAFASVLYRPHDTAFTEQLLNAARAGYRFLRERPADNTDGPTCPAMRQDGDASVGRDVRMYAAAGLLLATGERRFGVEFEENYQPLQNDPSYLRSNVYAALLYLRASAGYPERQRAIRRELRLRAEEVRRDGERHPFQWLVVPSGGPSRPASSGPPDLVPRVAWRTRSGRPPTASRCSPTCTMLWGGTTSRSLT